MIQWCPKNNPAPIAASRGAPTGRYKDDGLPQGEQNLQQNHLGPWIDTWLSWLKYDW